ncbi:MAG: protoporphyrinogen oxidase [Gemmatimonadales bacterium]
MRRLVVVGGGISGLAAAWAARERAASIPGGLEVLVLERGDDVGGKARTLRRDGWLMEGGPSGFLGGRAEMDRLITASGLSSEMIGAEKAAARRFVYRGGRMRQVVANPVGFALSGVLSARGFARMCAEPFIPRRRDDSDESVWDFAARRLGVEVADRLVSPMALGIFAGDARRLSLPAAFPRMAALEREHGSVIRGMIAKRGRSSSGPLTSFRDGMQSLPRALARRGGFAVRCNAEVRALVREESRWQVAVAGDAETIPADAVVLAGEPWASAALVRAHDATLAGDLDAIPCPPVAVVALGFGPDALACVPRGFGVLVSRGEGFRMLGNLWDTHVYPGRSPAGHLLVRAMFGGAVDPRAGALDETELSALARAEVARACGITSGPEIVHVVRVPRAIPQYELGHRERVARVERALASLGGLEMTGFGLRGVAFADAAADGVRTGERMAAWLARSQESGVSSPADEPVGDSPSETLHIR